jgi:hypothetical protein
VRARGELDLSLLCLQKPCLERRFEDQFMKADIVIDFSTMAIDADMGNPQPLLNYLQSAEPLSHQDRLLVAWVIERACVKTGRSITDIGDGSAAAKCAAYLASLGRAERRRSISSARLAGHEREMIAQKALDLLSPHFGCVLNLTADIVLSLKNVDHNSSVVSFVHEHMRSAVDEIKRFASRP